MDISWAATIASVASTIGVVLVAWLAYKTKQLDEKVDEVKEQTNGILMATTKAKDHAEGKSEAAIEIAIKQPPSP